MFLLTPCEILLEYLMHGLFSLVTSMNLPYFSSNSIAFICRIVIRTANLSSKSRLFWTLVMRYIGSHQNVKLKIYQWIIFINTFLLVFAMSKNILLHSKSYLTSMERSKILIILHLLLDIIPIQLYLINISFLHYFSAVLDWVHF